MLKIIVAMDQNRGIGINNALPWSIKEDLKEFKRITFGHSILMGRKTLDSIGKALPGRTNFVITRQETLPYEGITIVHDVHAFLKEKQKSDDLVFVIGGASLYRLALAYVDELILSEVIGQYCCDTFFPPIDFEDFFLTDVVDFDQFTQKRYVRKTR